MLHFIQRKQIISNLWLSCPVAGGHVSLQQKALSSWICFCCASCIGVKTQRALHLREENKKTRPHRQASDLEPRAGDRKMKLRREKKKLCGLRTFTRILGCFDFSLLKICLPYAFHCLGLKQHRYWLKFYSLFIWPLTQQHNLMVIFGLSQTNFIWSDSSLHLLLICPRVMQYLM